jgi:hypothetical protein
MHEEGYLREHMTERKRVRTVFDFCDVLRTLRALGPRSRNETFSKVGVTAFGQVTNMLAKESSVSRRVSE